LDHLLSVIEAQVKLCRQAGSIGKDPNGSGSAPKMTFWL